MYATLRVLELIQKGFDLDNEIDKLPKTYSTEEIKVPVSEDKKFELMKWIKEILSKRPSYLPEVKKVIDIDGVRINFENGWALVRASNTTPVLVTRYEATDEKSLQKYQQSVQRLINEAQETL